MSDNLTRVLPDEDSMTEALTKLGYLVIDPSQSLDEALQGNMEALAGRLFVINGLTKRGATLDRDYRHGTLQSMRRLANRIFDALERAEATRNPWDMEEK